MATRRGIGLALAQDFTVRVVPMDDPTCKDPADFVAKHGTTWNEVSAAAVPVLQYYYERASKGFDPSSPKSKRAAIQLMGPLIRRLASRVEQSHWIGQLAVLLRTDQASVQADVAAVKDDIAAAEQGPDEPSREGTKQPEIPLDALNEELLALLVLKPHLAGSAADVADAADPRVAAFLREPGLLNEPADDAQRRALDVAHLRADGWYAGYSPPQLAAQCALLVAKLRERDLRRRRALLEPLIREAEQRKDQGTVTALLTEFQQFTTELNRLQNIQTPPTA
jgi:DNA primase